MFILLSCKTQQVVPQIAYGTFYGVQKEKDFDKSYRLSLSEDGSFEFVIKQIHASPQCKGKWLLSSGKLMIECEESEVYEMISSGYLNERKHTFKILNQNKLSYRGVILKRKR